MKTTPELRSHWRQFSEGLTLGDALDDIDTLLAAIAMKDSALLTAVELLRRPGIIAAMPGAIRIVEAAAETPELK